jgi:hypothetical protein
MDSDKHLTDAELFSLAAPPSGEPEPLPRHLSHCEACSRALREWQGALADLAREDAAEIDRRTPEDWRAAQEATMAAIRRAGARRRAPVLRWAAGIAAALVLMALAMPWRRSAGPDSPQVATSRGETSPATLTSAADRDDDALLRDLEYLAQGGDDHADLAPEESL